MNWTHSIASCLIVIICMFMNDSISGDVSVFYGIFNTYACVCVCVFMCVCVCYVWLRWKSARQCWIEWKEYWDPHWKERIHTIHSRDRIQYNHNYYYQKKAPQMIKVSVEDGDEEAAVAIAEVCRTSTMICTNSKALDGMSKLMPLKTIRYDIYIYTI